MSRGQNELTAEFKMSPGNVISIGKGVGYEVQVHSSRNKSGNFPAKINGSPNERLK